MTEKFLNLTVALTGLALIGIAVLSKDCSGGGSDRGKGAGECSPNPSGYNPSTGKWECGK